MPGAQRREEAPSTTVGTCPQIKITAYSLQATVVGIFKSVLKMLLQQFCFLVLHSNGVPRLWNSP
jgi:hypothetical protein